MSKYFNTSFQNENLGLGEFIGFRPQVILHKNRTLDRPLAILIRSLVSERHIRHIDRTSSRCGIRCAPSWCSLFVSPVHTSRGEAASVHGFFQYSRDLLGESAMLGGCAPFERLL
jgi:hypothetical protein